MIRLIEIQSFDRHCKRWDREAVLVDQRHLRVVRPAVLELGWGLPAESPRHVELQHVPAHGRDLSPLEVRRLVAPSDRSTS